MRGPARLVLKVAASGERSYNMRANAGFGLGTDEGSRAILSEKARRVPKSGR